MIILTPILLICALNLAYLAILPSRQIPADFILWKDIVTTAIALYLFIVAGALLRRLKTPAAEKVIAPAPGALPITPAQREKLIDAEIVHFLSLLQEKGRLLDFLMDDITPYDNAQVGAAARVVHQGCSAVLKEHFCVSPVAALKEGQPISLPADYDSRSYRIVGKTAPEAPFSGAVVHPGWKTGKVSLPRVTSAAAAAENFIITPAEVEVK